MAWVLLGPGGRRRLRRLPRQDRRDNGGPDDGDGCDKGAPSRTVARPSSPHAGSLRRATRGVPQRCIHARAVIGAALVLLGARWWRLGSHRSAPVVAGYRHIHLIGPAFLAQGIGGLILAVTLDAYRRLAVIAVGAAYLAGSIGALLLSASVGFLGLHDGPGRALGGVVADDRTGRTREPHQRWRGDPARQLEQRMRRAASALLLALIVASACSSRAAATVDPFGLPLNRPILQAISAPSRGGAGIPRV